MEVAHRAPPAGRRPAHWTASSACSFAGDDRGLGDKTNRSRDGKRFRAKPYYAPLLSNAVACSWRPAMTLLGGGSRRA